MFNLNYLRHYSCSLSSYSTGIIILLVSFLFEWVCFDLYSASASFRLWQVLIPGNLRDQFETLNSHESDMEWHLVNCFNLQVAIYIIPNRGCHGTSAEAPVHLRCPHGVL